MIFKHGEQDLSDILLLIDGDGGIWDGLTYVDTSTGQVVWVRKNTSNGELVPMPVQPNIPGMQEGAIAAQCSSIILPHPLTVVFASPEIKKQIAAGEIPDLGYFGDMIRARIETTEEWKDGDTALLNLDMAQQRMEQAQQRNIDKLHDEEDDEPTAEVNVIREFTCPLCGAGMREKYSSKLEWYLKCTECSAQVIK